MFRHGPRMGGGGGVDVQTWSRGGGGGRCSDLCPLVDVQTSAQRGGRG